MIPVWITNRNRLTSVKGMLDYLLPIDGIEVRIYDNESTYPPLLEWYEKQNIVEVVRSDTNRGSKAVWGYKGLYGGHGPCYYVVMDADLDLTGIPTDLFELFREGLDRYPNIRKTGPSLEITDLPDECPTKARAIAVEEKFWSDRLDDKWFNAAIDTHMSMYRPNSGWGGYGNSLRADRPYVARHLPWYVTPETVTDEDRYYAKHATMTSHWMEPWRK